MARRGRPKGSLNDKAWGDALRRAVNERGEGKAKNLDVLAKRTVEAALNGEAWATMEIGNRLDGKPQQSQDLTITHQPMVARLPHKAKDAEEWLANLPAVH